MKSLALRDYLVEFAAVFALVYLSAGVVIVNAMTIPTEQSATGTLLVGRHPGLVGIALAQACVLAAVLSASVGISGGYANPAILLSLWVFGRCDSARAAWLLGAQIVGAASAGLALRFTFSDEVLEAARLGTPHLSELAYPALAADPIPGSAWWSAVFAGIGIEFVLTFFLVFAIFGTVTALASSDAERAESQAGRIALAGGVAMLACVVFGYSLTGAALNPSRWVGCVLWEAFFLEPRVNRGPLADGLVYTAGPVLGAIAAGGLFFLGREKPTIKKAGQASKTRKR